jgi:hypothetical protein
MAVNLTDSLQKNIYLKKIKSVSGFMVWYVNGKYIREKIEIEFTNFGHHLDFEFIPKNEFWIDFENSPDETDFYIQHMLYSYDLMSKGYDYDFALEKADSVEKIIRLNSKLSKELLLLRDKYKNETKIIEKIHKKKIDYYNKNLNIWIVHGEMVRNIYFIDFTEGGHDKVYSFIPSGEVWLDDDLIPSERRYILLHELHERYKMTRGIEYPEAHEESSKLELYCRRNPNKLDSLLIKEIKRKY